MEREKLLELELIISDLRMALETKEQIEAGVERGLIDFADGERLSIPIPDNVRARLDKKIEELSNLLEQKVTGREK